MNALNHSTILFFICLLLIPAGLTAQKENNSDTDTSKVSSQSDNPDLNYFTNTILVNQHGEKMKFYEDLLKDKIVIINAFFKGCKGNCPIIHSAMASIQQHYSNQVGQDIYLISITIDPKNDTPEKLKEYSKQWTKDPGWFFLSGDIENVNFITKKLGKFVESRENHDSILLIGNISTKLWKKVNGLAPLSEIIENVDGVINDQKQK